MNRNAKTVTQTVDHWDSNQDAISVTVNVLLVSNTTRTGLTYTYSYDTLKRRISMSDPRTGTSITAYNSKGQVTM